MKTVLERLLEQMYRDVRTSIPDQDHLTNPLRQRFTPIMDAGVRPDHAEFVGAASTTLDAGAAYVSLSDFVEKYAGGVEKLRPHQKMTLDYLSLVDRERGNFGGHVTLGGVRYGVDLGYLESYASFGFEGTRITVSAHALRDTDEQLILPSRHRSRRVLKKLLKRHGGYYRREPAAYVMPGTRTIVMHPEIYRQMSSKLSNGENS